MTRPNGAGQLTVGVISTPGDPQMGTVINGVFEIVREHGGRVVDIAAPVESVGLPLPSSESIDGWVVVHWQEGVPELVATGVPVVTVNLDIEGLGCPTVLPDNAGGTYELISHVIAMGRRRIAFLGDMRHQDVRDRYAGYAAALAEHHIPVDPTLVLGIEDPDDIVACQIAFRRIAEGGLRCDAIFAGHDYNAQRLIKLAQRAGHRVPEDLAVVGFDDIETAQYCVPPLTTVRQQFVEQGRVAAWLLLARLKGEAIPLRVNTVPTALVVRRSCGSTAAEAGPQAPRPAQAADAGGWRHLLQRDLATALRAPLPLAEDETPELVWPGVARISEALDSAASGELQQNIDSLDPVWQAGCQNSPSLVNVLAILDHIEQAARALARRSADPGAAERLDSLTRMVRLRLLWHHQAQGSNAGSQTTHVAEVYQWAVTALLDSGRDAERLDWVQHTNDVWACFGRWEGRSRTADGALRIVGEYPEAGRGGLLGRRIPAAQFPPLDRLPEQFRRGEHMLKVLPVQTAGAYWGLLALCGPIEPRLYSPTLAQILGNVLDNKALQAERAEQEQVLRQAYERERGLAETVRALGSPVIPISRGVLLVPLIGAIDGGRAQQVIERVLSAVSEERAATVLIDLTGVPLVDTEVASAIVQTARATTLLGAEVLLVGIRPEIAQSIVGLGIDLRSIRSFSSLAAALQTLRRNGAL